ncbi:MAG: acyl carrier protein [Lachnospiraceae bacterium]|nr:acyl carrier protein [Lachnospiraceae bacterium]
MEELMEILSELHPEVDFGQEERLVDGEILDSFDIITIISEIADTFDVVVPAKEIVPENFNSAGSLWKMIQRLEDGE